MSFHVRNAIMGVALGLDKRDRRPVLRGTLALLAGFSAAIVITVRATGEDGRAQHRLVSPRARPRGAGGR